jgi:Dimerisation domain
MARRRPAHGNAQRHRRLRTPSFQPAPDFSGPPRFTRSVATGVEVALTPASSSVMDEHQAELVRMITEYRVTQAIHVAAALGIADLLAHGPRASDELAESAGAYPDALYRLLRALASVGVFSRGGRPSLRAHSCR